MNFISRSIFVIAICIMNTVFLICQDKDADRAQQVITSGLLKKHIEYLASDRMLGRNTPSPQLDSCADYIAQNFKGSGLRPVNNSYFEPLGLNRVNLGNENILRLTKSGTEKIFEIKTDYVPFELTANREVSGEVVFAGYGITAPEYQYDDYQNLDVKGKIVVALRHEPGENDSSSIFDGTRSTIYSSVEKKMEIAVRHGAVALFIITDPLNHALLTPRGFPWPALFKNVSEESIPITLSIDESQKIPVVHIGEGVAEFLFGSIDNLRQIQKQIDSTLKTNSYTMTGVSGEVKTSTIIEKVYANNVVGYLEGSDPVLKNELVIIGGHYDHIGYIKNAAPGTDSIYNGADDNASGASGVVAVAKAFGALIQHPRRSILFMTFAGEEKGLWGSKWYVEHPLFPLEKTIAMLNLDMIGRNNPDSVSFIGYKKCIDVDSVALIEHARFGFGIQRENEKYIMQSDHASFMKKKVPLIFFSTGGHTDMHKVTDSPDKINFEKASRISQLVFRIAHHIANDNHYFHMLN